jgi:ribokinase
MPAAMLPTKKSSPRILVFGDLNVDIIGRVQGWPKPGGECLCSQVDMHCGGVAANTALALRSWGVHVHLAGCVGGDAFGDFLFRTLRKAGVHVRDVQRTSRALTGLLYINVTPDGQRTFFGSRGANQFTNPERFSSPTWNRCAAAHLVGYSFLNPGPEKTARQILRSFQSRCKPVSLDVGMEPAQRIPEKIRCLLPQMDVLFLSSEEAAALTCQSNPRRAFVELECAGAREVVMKCGKRGCLIRDGATVCEVPSFTVRALDTTGAGDALTATFLQARLRGWPMRLAALLANAAGAAAVSHMGAGTALCDVAEILRLLRRQRLPAPWGAIRSEVLLACK